jgi:hypothetical protein
VSLANNKSISSLQRPPMRRHGSLASTVKCTNAPRDSNLAG